MSGEHILEKPQELVEIFNMLDEGIIVVDLDDTIIYVNSRALRLLGYKKPELLNKDAHKLIHYKNGNGEFIPKDKCENLKKVFEKKETVRSEDFFVRKDGTLFPVRMSFTPIFKKSKLGPDPNSVKPHKAIIVFEDNSLQKKAFKDLQESENRFKMLADSAPVMIWFSDNSGSCTYFNQGWLNFTGRKLEDEIGMGWIKHVHPEDINYCKKTYLRSFKNRSNFSMEYRLKRSDGKYHWILDKGVPRYSTENKFLGFLGTAIDIEEIKEAESMILSEKERLKLAQSAANIGTFELDLDTDEMTWTEDQEKLYGLKSGQFDGKLNSYLKLIHPLDRNWFQSILPEIKNKKKSFHFQFRIIHPDGSIHWIMAISKVFRNLNGKPQKVVGINMDITGQIQTQESLKFLAEASKIFSSSLDFKSTLESVAKMAVPMIADWCIVNMLNHNGELDVLTVSNASPEKLKLAEKLKRYLFPRISKNIGLTQVINTGKSEYYPVVTDELIRRAVQTDKDFKIIKNMGFSSIMIVPLTVQKKTIGAITFVSTESGRSFSPSDLHVAEQLASRATLAMDNARLYKWVQEQNQRLSNVVANVPGIVSESLGVPGSKKYKVTFISEYAIKMLGYSEKEWLSTNDFWSRITHPEDKNLVSVKSKEFFNSGKEDGQKIFRMITKNGQVKWVESHSAVVKDNQGKPVGLRGVTMDITERIHSEQKVRELASIVESSDDAIIGQDLEGVIKSWNNGAEKIYGYSSAEILGKKIFTLIPSSKKEEYLEIMEVIKLGESIDHLETQRLTKDGRLLDMSLSMSPMRDESGSIIGSSGIGRDISVQKELERRKDAFIGMASHELKTPITSIKAFIQVLQQRFKHLDDPMASRFLAKTDEQLNRLTDLVSDLLDLSKIQAGKLELNKQKLDLNQIIHDTIEEIQATTDHVITSTGVLNKELYGDKDRLSQVLINLLTNAIKYSPNANKVYVNVNDTDNKVTIAIRDFGIGISKSQQKRIFDRFYRAEGTSEKTFPGLGIGLYISSEIVRRHGGTIWVESIKKKGSTFAFTLPYK